MSGKMLPASAAPLELAWTGVAFLGGGVATALLVTIWRSYRAVADWIEHGRLVRWGPRHRFVLGFLVGIFLLMLLWAGFLALGVNAIANPPPTTPDRAAASERGGWLLVGLEAVLFAFQAILLYAWVSVGRPTLDPGRAPNSPVALLFRAIDLGREMGHAVRNEAQEPVALLDEIAHDERAPSDVRSRAVLALAALERLVGHVDRVHRAVKALEGES